MHRNFRNEIGRSPRKWSFQIHGSNSITGPFFSRWCKLDPAIDVALPHKNSVQCQTENREGDMQMHQHPYGIAFYTIPRTPKTHQDM